MATQAPLLVSSECMTDLILNHAYFSSAKAAAIASSASSNLAGGKFRL